MPFTKEQFFQLFLDYNTAVGPLIWLIYFGAIWVVCICLLQGSYRNRITFGYLSFLWLWMGIIYHWGFFTKINPAASAFGALFVAEAFVLAWAALKNWNATFMPLRSVKGALQRFLIIYALLIYPLIGIAMDHGYPRGPILGLPCPTTIFTISFVSTLDSRRRVFLAGAIPALWALIGTSAASLFGVTEDLMLSVSALFLALGIVLQRQQKSNTKLKTPAIEYESPAL